MNSLLVTTAQLLAESNELRAGAMYINSAIADELQSGDRSNLTKAQIKCQQIEATKMIKLAIMLNETASQILSYCDNNNKTK